MQAGNVFHSERICKKNQFSHCRFGRFCLYKHVDTKCDIVDCRDMKCVFRHPPPCRNILQKKSCPWGSCCSFNHGDNDIKTNNFEKELKKRIDDLENSVKAKDAEIQRLKVKIVELVSASDDEEETSESEDEVQSTTASQISDLEPVEIEASQFECDKCGKVFS